MSRHLIQLERRKANLTAMSGLCAQLRDSRCTLAGLDADGTLAQMARQEQEGTKFMDVKKKDDRRKYVAPIVAAVVIIALMGMLVWLLAWACASAPEDAPPLPLILTVLAALAAVMLGVLAALIQRLREIKGGEEDAAAQY